MSAGEEAALSSALLTPGFDCPPISRAGRQHPSTRATLKRDFTAINDEANVQDFSEIGHEVAGLQQPIDISDVIIMMRQ